MLVESQENHLNEQLRAELIAMKDEDQRVARELMESGELYRVAYHPRMRAVHEKNNARIKAIVEAHGWPGISLVGYDGAKAAWLLVQHAVLDIEFMRRASLVLRVAVGKGEAEAWWWAYLKDKILVMSNKPQIFGTQHDFDAEGFARPLPIAEPDKVDELRKEFGLEPLSEATKKIQERYRPGPSRPADR